MRNFIKHLKIYIFRGILATIPLALSFFVLQLIYVYIDQRIANLFDQLIGFRIPGFGIIIFLIVLYFIGFLTSNILGRKVFNIMENIMSRIPIIKTIYQVGKQLSSTLSLPEKQVFKRVVLVEYFRPGVWTVGFVTGTVLDKKNNEKILKVFIPTVPNPTSGFLVLLKENQAIDPKWSIEQGMKAVLSGGIIGPEEIE